MGKNLEFGFLHYQSVQLAGKKQTIYLVHVEESSAEGWSVWQDGTTWLRAGMMLSSKQIHSRLWPDSLSVSRLIGSTMRVQADAADMFGRLTAVQSLSALWSHLQLRVLTMSIMPGQMSCSITLKYYLQPWVSTRRYTLTETLRAKLW